MTDPKTDTEFEEFLKRRTLLRRGVAVEAREEPSPHVDAAVLRMAREGLQGPAAVTGADVRSPTRRYTRTPGWALSAGIAASIVLCLSVALKTRFNAGHESLPSTALTSTAQTSAMDAAADKAQPPSSPAAAPAPVAPAPAPALGDVARADNKLAQAEAMRGALAARSALAKSDRAAAPVDPQAWLKRIKALRAAGRTQQAEAELARFRAAFPAYRTEPDAPDPLRPSN